MVEIEWDAKQAEQRLTELVAAEAGDDAAILEQATRLMNLEVEKKRQHLALLLKIRAQLTAEQRETLDAVRPGDPLAALLGLESRHGVERHRDRGPRAGGVPRSRWARLSGLVAAGCGSQTPRGRSLRAGRGAGGVRIRGPAPPG